MTYSVFPLRFSNSLKTVYLQIEFTKSIYQTNERIYARTNSNPLKKKNKKTQKTKKTKEKNKNFRVVLHNSRRSSSSLVKKDKNKMHKMETALFISIRRLLRDKAPSTFVCVSERPWIS